VKDISINIKTPAKDDTRVIKHTQKKADAKSKKSAVDDKTNLNLQPSSASARYLVSTKGACKKEIDPSSKYRDFSHKRLLEELDKKAKQMEARQGFAIPYFSCFENSDDDTLRKILGFLDLGLSPESAGVFAKEKDKEVILKAKQRLNSLRDLGVETDRVYPEILLTDDEKFKDCETFFEKHGLDETVAIRNLLRIDDENYPNARYLILEKGAGISSASFLFNGADGTLGKLRTEKFKELQSMGHTPDNCCLLAAIYNPEHPEDYENAIMFNKRSFDVKDSCALAGLTPEARKTALALLDEYDVSDAVSIAQYCTAEQKQFLPLVSQFKKFGCEDWQIPVFLYSTDPSPEEILENLERMTDEKDRKYSGKAAVALAGLNKEQLGRAEKYFEYCRDIELALKLAVDKELTEREHKNVEALLQRGFFQEAVEDAKGNNVADILEEADRKDDVFRKILENDPDFSFDDLTARDKFYLRIYGFDNKFYTPKEYVHKFLQLKNMRTKDGFRIFDTEHFNRKFSEDYSEMQNPRDGFALYNNLVKALWIDPETSDSKYFNNFLQMIQNGTISPSAMRFLEPAVLPLPSGEKKKIGDWSVSLRLKKDIDLYKKVQSKSAGADFEKNLLEAYVPTYKTEADALASARTGDAFQLEDEEYIRIKTDNSTSKPMKITKETYAKLFPPASRFSTAQQILGDCYLLESLMSLYCDERTRADIVSLFSEDKNGNITVKFPKSKTAVTYKDFKLPKGQNEETFSSGADGFKFLEHAYSMAIQDGMISDVEAKLSPERRAEFADFLDANKEKADGIFLYADNGEPYWTTFSDAVKKRVYKHKGKFNHSHFEDFNQYLIGNGANIASACDMLGYNCRLYDKNIKPESAGKAYKTSINNLLLKHPDLPAADFHSYEKLKSDMKKPDFFDSNVVMLAIDRHARSLAMEKDENGNAAYYLYNPHNQGLPVKIDNLDELIDFVCKKADSVTVLEI